MKKIFWGIVIVGILYIISIFGESGPENKYGERIPLQFGGGYDLTEEPIQDFIDDWRLGDTSLPLEGGFAYPIGGWFTLSFKKGVFDSRACENCNETPVIKLNPDGSGKMLTYTVVYDNKTSRIIASAYPEDTPNCLDEKVNWKFNKLSGELKITLLRGSQSDACYQYLNSGLSKPFKRNKNGVWVTGNKPTDVIFSHSGRDFGD